MRLKTLGVALLVVLGAMAALSWPAYLVAKTAFERYFDRWGQKLVDLEQRGLLSTEFGAAWQDILTNQAMEQQAQRLTEDTTGRQTVVAVVDGVRLRDYPSLSLVARLNEVNVYSNTISIVDRKQRPVATIRTDHTRGQFEEFPQTLVRALVAAEDERFWNNRLGFEFRSYVRAALTAAWKTVSSFRLRAPQGTSTITQQVAKLFISRLDEEGRRHVSRSIGRKLREMRIAAALRKMYSPEEILEVYLNHCVTSDYGLIGCKDIALGLFSCAPAQLSDAQCLYVARMVKWGRNLRDKIVRQCHVDMPRMARALEWDRAKQHSVLTALDSLQFAQPRRVVTDHGQLVDCANEYWLAALRRNGTPEDELVQLDIIDPNSLIRRKGNLTVQLTIDLGLQKQLEKLVANRGYGPDTTIRTEVRIGSTGEDVTSEVVPLDTLRHACVLSAPDTFAEPGAQYRTALDSGDTLITNVRYRKTGRRAYRRSVFWYTPRMLTVDGQYYAYAVMDSRSGKLLAYCSRDQIGSRLAGLSRYRTPNGSSTAKPIFNALCFDQGVFAPYDMWNDSLPVAEPVAWQRSLVSRGGRAVGVRFARSAVPGRGYEVHNHDDVFEGCQYVFEHLAVSNNILGVETCYRLDRQLYSRDWDLLDQAFPMVQYYYRLGALPRIREKLKLRYTTGVRAYRELARIVGAPVDSVGPEESRRAVSDSLYSVALGTLELSLLEQMHLFNVLYGNDLIERPAEHPSLFVDSLRLNGRPVPVSDTIKRYHPFADVNNIRPTWLGMHKRLISNPWDRLGAYDIAWPLDSAAMVDTVFDPNALLVDEPLSNFAKSGTTDDIIRPFYASADSKERTNYGMWNAVIRIDLSKFDRRDTTPDIRDVTLSCIGECVTRYTGPRDGKTLHGYLSRGLLKRAGTPSPGGFYSQYERYLRQTTPAAARDCGRYLPPPDTAAADTGGSAAASVVE